MATKQKSTRSRSKSKKGSWLSKGTNRALIFILAFAAVGVYLLWHSFAASAPVLGSANLVKAESVNATVLTETSGSKKGGNVVQLIGGSSSKAVYITPSTVDNGIYSVCPVAKASTSVSGKIAVTVGTSTITGDLRSGAAADYGQAGCATGITIKNTTAKVTITNTTSGAALKIGSVVFTKTGEVNVPQTGSGGCSQNGTPTPCIGNTTTGQSGWGGTKFADEFNDNSIDLSAWSPTWLAGNTGNNGYSKPINTKETGCYHTSQASEHGGSLHLVTASSNPDFCKTRTGTSKIQSGIVTSAGKKEYRYGYFEARINMPAAVNWPAWWTNGKHVSWPDRGELDIMENLECRHPAWRIHFPKSGGGDMNYGQCEDIPITGWHIYGMNWTPNRVDFYYDGNHVGGTNVSIPYDHYMVLNHGVRKDYPNGEVLNQDMQVDYARVWQK